MEIDDGDLMFRNIERDFTSPFPSMDSLASGKFNGLLNSKDATNAGSFARWSGEAFVNALQITERRRAVFAGDLLNTQLTKIYSTVQGVGGNVIRGLFAAVVFRPDTSSPGQLIQDMEKVGFAAAMTVLASQPVYGQIAAAVITVARKLVDMFATWMLTRSPPATLPWAEYSRDLDADIVRHFHDKYAGDVDWTPLFLPPFDAEPWQFARRSKAEQLDGVIFAPVRAGAVAWNDNYGALPNTSRVFGHTQSALHPRPHPAVLDRLLDGQGKQRPPIPWRIEVTQTGDYQPALGQLGLALWKQCERPGPEMFRVHAAALRDRWRECSDNLLETGLESLAAITQQLKVPVPAMSLRTFGSQLLEPYVPARRKAMPWSDGFDVYPYETNDPKGRRRTWQLGLFPNSPRPNPIIHEGLWSEGAVDPQLRTAAAWFEQNLARKGWGWPYRTEPRQDLDRLASATGLLTPGDLVPSGLKAGSPSKGMRAVPWPFPELAAMEFGRLYQQIVAGPVLYLRGMQETVLGRVFNEDVKAGACDDRVLLPAYIRPDPVEVDGGTLPRYGAFLDPVIRQQCRDAREQLLHLIRTPLTGGGGHPAGQQVDLADADAVDPKFAARIRAAIAAAPAVRPLDRVPPGGPFVGPKPEEPSGGVAFGDLAPPAARAGGARVAAYAAAGLTAWWFLR
jgi:hypothetical protein